MKVLVIHGPNLDLLGVRETNIYGQRTLEEINKEINKHAKELHLDVTIMQSNHEGEIVDAIGKSMGKYDMVIMNPAGYTHTSVAIRDAIAAAQIPTIEVHLSNIFSREEFRRKSLISPVVLGQISGFGIHSYLLALRACASVSIEP